MKHTIFILFFSLSFSTQAQTVHDTIADISGFISNEFKFYFNDQVTYETKGNVKFKKNVDRLDVFSMEGWHLTLNIVKSPLYLKSYTVYEIQILDRYTIGNQMFKFDTETWTLLNMNYKILLGYNKSDKKILSGNLYNSIYSSLFSLNPKQPNSYLDYLKFKLYKYDVKEIEFEKSRGGWLFFSAYSKYDAKKIFFKIKIDFPDIVVYQGFKLNGKYKTNEKEKVY